MPAEPKLTKKQKKGIAFRERKGKTKAAPEEPADIPELEVQDEQEQLTDGPASVQKHLLDGPISEGKLANRKRKRTDLEDGEGVPDAAVSDSAQAPPGRKVEKRQKEISTESGDSKDPGATGEVPDVKAKKFILFVGNLPYTITKEQIEAHFSECKPPPSIRLLTSKPRSGKPQSAVQAAKSKGCAFLEFSSHAAMQLAIRKHHTELAGRRINVELTAGGGGNSGQRKEKLRTRNRTLDEQRKKGADRLAAKSLNSDTVPQLQTKTPTRHSTTSGAADQPRYPKTWSISTDKDLESSTKTRRKSKGKKVAKMTSWSPSGANAISVG
ncbi:hypothetical protein FRC07_003805 [Ceratobasidium sp. 392]|nr:hypothetical protein FRC07_003805 [Ceratobasidium sp. 392]